MEESLEYCENAVVTYLNAPEVLQPSVGALDFPALAVASQFAFVLKATTADVLPIGDNQFGPAPAKAPAQGIGIVAAIGNHPLEMRTRPSAALARDLHLGERAFGETTLGQLRGRKLCSDRYAVVVDHHHALRTFPTTGFADRGAPFLAVMKVASRKASSQSSNRRWSSIDNSFRHAFSHTSCSSQLRNRRQHVEPSGNSSGRSRHRAPVRNTQRMPSRHSRLPAHDRARPSLRRLGSGNNGSSIFHCSSLSNSCCFFIEEDQQLTRLRRKSLA